jgi:hypothetical protein
MHQIPFTQLLKPKIAQTMGDSALFGHKTWERSGYVLLCGIFFLEQVLIRRMILGMLCVRVVGRGGRRWICDGVERRVCVENDD